MFLDCQWQCDQEFLKKEITFVDWMRDRADADVHVLVTSQGTGGGGSEYTLKFIGLGRFANVEQTLRIFGETLIRLGRGRVRVNNDRIYKDVWGQGHTLGTTRMGTSRDDSVVDGECRVHGYENLFVGGSSVFPSGGYANPTLTIVALALRLADTIAGTR